MARPVDDREQQVADLLGAPRRRRRASTSASSSSILARGPLGIGPVEADARGALLQLLGAEQRGQAERDAVQRAAHRALPARSSALIASQKSGSPSAASPKMCGWRRSILSQIAVDDVVAARKRRLPRPCGVEDDLEQQVAKFVLQIGHVVARDRVGDFIGFLDRVRRDRRESLRAIPFAAGLRIAQPRHDRDQPVDRRSTSAPIN